MASFDSTMSASSTSASAMVETLSPIWRSVLNRSDIAVDASFFSLGGNLLAADLMFAEIARQLGRVLPTATLFHAPTITDLAAVLSQPTLPQFSSLIPLKSGTGKTPILITPGLNGCASFSGLAKSIQSDHPIYGLQAKGVDGLEEPLGRVEDTAEFFLHALADLPWQSYILVGYSFGGLVAVEMAQQLVTSQKHVALLVLIDAFPHPRFLSEGQRLRLSLRRAKRHISEMRQRSIGDAISYLTKGVQRRLHRKVGRADVAPPETSPLSLARTTLAVKAKSYAALGCYRPRVYSGKITFVKSASDNYFPNDPAAIWGPLAAGIEVETIAGDHLNIVTTHSEALAAALTRYLAKA
jgi:acetoacetyl-CoA synthetase